MEMREMAVGIRRFPSSPFYVIQHAQKLSSHGNFMYLDADNGPNNTPSRELTPSQLDILLPRSQFTRTIRSNPSIIDYVCYLAIMKNTRSQFALVSTIHCSHINYSGLRHSFIDASRIDYATPPAQALYCPSYEQLHRSTRIY
ncbi:hypothetical protein CVT25_014190 [Psilocybe cyanescens]|uniref:Uncharacterized protein n=1 Tax=Psilocybe cyanescens TaxID=93625 RepID=A0A409XID5_PSICY|nr:hypothetical protein CVT25_014190 [Psilocybe cyanescens]